jgi:hypothetical protein
MPERQRQRRLTLPEDPSEKELARNWTLSEADREATESSYQQRLREYFGYRTLDDEARILLG